MRNRIVLAAVLLFVAACKKDTSPTNPVAPDTGTPGPSGATITIQNNAVSPTSVSITVGQSVTFVNSDSRTHDMASDPHPTHTDCPAINAVGAIGTGQTKLTNALSRAATCGFHDHTDPTNANLHGSITVR